MCSIAWGLLPPPLPGRSWPPDGHLCDCSWPALGPMPFIVAMFEAAGGGGRGAAALISDVQESKAVVMAEGIRVGVAVAVSQVQRIPRTLYGRLQPQAFTAV